MQNKTYSDLLALVQALAGVDMFTTQEQSKVLAMANRRLYQAYNMSPTWPRYIIGAQVRPASDSLISRSYDATAGVESVTTATRSGLQVTIVCSTGISFVEGMNVTVSGLSGTVSPNGTFSVTGVSTTTNTNDTFTYDVASGTGTETYTGTGTVTPVAIPDIGTFSRVWDSNPLGTTYSNEYEFYVDADGAHVINNASGLNGFWVSFKKEWDGPYASTATDIPLEFFYYAAHATYADFLRMDGQVDKAMAEENAANTYIMLELEKAESQRNNNALYRRISTYNSRQSR